MIDRGGRRRLNALIQTAAVLGLLLVAAAGSVAYQSSPAARIPVVLSLILLGASHILMTREIHRREHAERELHAANRELESFSYSVSHDLRAPLRTIDGFSQALVEDAAPLLPPDARSHVDRIRAATQRMGHLIDDLIGLSRLSRAEMKRERIDVTDLVEQIAADLRRHTPDRKIDVLVRRGMTAVADPHLLRLVFQNLLENAWKFTSRREHATIDVGQSHDDDGVPAFYVGDNGAGFDPDYAHKLFGPFQGLHSPAEFPGTGIGLATVQRIVHRHGGHVWAEGEINQGACFYFTLE